MALVELIDASPASVVSGAVDTRTALANQLATYAAFSMVMPVPMMVPSFSGITDAQCGENRCFKACQCCFAKPGWRRMALNLNSCDTGIRVGGGGVSVLRSLCTTSS
jgi:hypothetical protein